MTSNQISLNDLANKSLAFAEKAGSPWKETAGSDCQAYQRSFLCRQSFGAYHTAKSYWILHENKCFSDCIALGRNLLERIANSICGSQSPTQAVELIASELGMKKYEMLKNGIRRPEFQQNCNR